VAAAGLLCVGCGGTDKLAEPLARPPILEWEPLPPAGSNAEMAAAEHAYQSTEQPGALEPTGSLAGRQAQARADAAPKPKPEPPPRTEPDRPIASSRLAPRLPPAPEPSLEHPAPKAAAMPELALELPPAPLPAMPVPPEPKTTREVTVPLAPLPARTAAMPRSAPQSCPPADRDGVVHCPIFAGWAGPSDLDRAARGPGGRDTALLLLGVLIAAGIFDVLRRALR
jgi:hypothetical protein